MNSISAIQNRRDSRFLNGADTLQDGRKASSALRPQDGLAWPGLDSLSGSREVEDEKANVPAVTGRVGFCQHWAISAMATNNHQVQNLQLFQPVGVQSIAPWSLHTNNANALSTGNEVVEDRRSVQIREEWSEEATDAVIEEWGEKHLAINRGKLKKQEWDEVAEKVSNRLGGGKNTKTWLQCKNKIDSIKKKYKIVSLQRASGTQKREWRLYDRVDALLGGAMARQGMNGESDGEDDMEMEEEEMLMRHQQLAAGQSIPDYGRRMASGNPQSNPIPGQVPGQPPVLPRNGTDRILLKKRKEGPHLYSELALAIKEFGSRYEKVEMARQEKMFELEKMRISYMKDVEMQRMQMHLQIAQMTAAKDGHEHQGVPFAATGPQQQDSIPFNN